MFPPLLSPDKSSGQGSIILMLGYNNIMDNQEQAILDLIEYAQAGNHLDFKLITSWTEYWKARKLRKDLRSLIKRLRASMNRLFKDYCKRVVKGTANVNDVVAYVTFNELVLFETEELKIVEDILDEYETYLSKNNFIISLLGFERPYSDQYDFRKEF